MFPAYCSEMDKRTKRAQPGEQVPVVNNDEIPPAVAAALAAQQLAFQSIVDTQLKTFQACMQSYMEATNRRFDDFVRQTVSDIADIKASVQFSHIELHDMQLNVRQSGEVQAEKTRMTDRLATGVKRIDDITDYLENQSRRNNLRVDGVKEKPGETWAEPEEALRRVVQRELKLPAEQVAALQIERAHRTGAATAQRDRTIVVKLLQGARRHHPSSSRSQTEGTIR